MLKDVLQDFTVNSRTTYTVLEETVHDVPAGFIIFGKTPLTQFCWDVYWLVVSPEFQRKGVGKKLLSRVLDHLVMTGEKIIVRVETSTRKEYANARNFYVKMGFVEAGRIKDFYSREDDLIVFCRYLSRMPGN